MFVNHDQTLVICQLLGVNVNLNNHRRRAIINCVTVSPYTKVFPRDIRFIKFDVELSPKSVMNTPEHISKILGRRKVRSSHLPIC